MKNLLQSALDVAPVPAVLVLASVGVQLTHSEVRS